MIPSSRKSSSFTTDLAACAEPLSLEGKPWGVTSLFDAIEQTRAAWWASGPTSVVPLLVDYRRNRYGQPDDTLRQVSGIASMIDVPVYLLVVVNPADHPEGEFEARPDDAKTSQQGELADLSRWTGGDLRFASVPSPFLSTQVREHPRLSCGFSTSSRSSRVLALGGTESKSELGSGTWRCTHEAATCRGR